MVFGYWLSADGRTAGRQLTQRPKPLSVRRPVAIRVLDLQTGEAGVGSACSILHWRQQVRNPAQARLAGSGDKIDFMSSRSDPGSFGFVALLFLERCSGQRTSPHGGRGGSPTYRMCALVRFSSLLTKTTTDVQKSLALCASGRSRMTFCLADVGEAVAGFRIDAQENEPELVSSLASRSSSSVRGAARALPVQLETSPTHAGVLHLNGNGKSLIVAEVMRDYRLRTWASHICCAVMWDAGALDNARSCAPTWRTSAPEDQLNASAATFTPDDASRCRALKSYPSLTPCAAADPDPPHQDRAQQVHRGRRVEDGGVRAAGRVLDQRRHVQVEHVVGHLGAVGQAAAAEAADAKF